MDKLPINSIKTRIIPGRDRGSELLGLVRWQVDFGHRYPGSAAHREFTTALADYLKLRVPALYEQRFAVTLQGKTADCVNLIAHLPAAIPEAQAHRPATTPERQHQSPLLIGTHFDSRLIADNESDPLLRDQPIPGANDGGSGTAILLHLLDLCQGLTFTRDLLFVFFDAEDIGNIDNHPFSVGARYLAAHPLPLPPAEVLILDMVGGKNMVLDVDAHSCLHPGSRKQAERLFRLAETVGYQPLLQHKEHKLKYIICDHIPFLEKNIPGFVLIDIDYPEWHTQADLPEALSADSLLATEDFLIALLAPYGKSG